MKLAVFSDSHGYPDKMIRAIEQSAPDMIIHLGDGGTDISQIEKQFPHIPLKAVRGNCDLSSNLPETELFSVGAVKIYITHGHLYGVKRVLYPLIDKAIGLDANIVMYGHTHIADCSMVGGLHLLNPGTCGLSVSPSYAEVVIDDKGNVFPRILMI